jgi:hypothetical protein
MARLTLEALERRDLLSASLLAERLAPPPPPDHLTVILNNTMVSGFSGSQPHVYLSLELENTLVSSFSASHRPGTVAETVSISFVEVKF